MPRCQRGLLAASEKNPNTSAAGLAIERRALRIMVSLYGTTRLRCRGCGLVPWTGTNSQKPAIMGLCLRF
jgi:hypothetical protein